LPDLVRDVRALQTRIQAFTIELDTLDRPLAQRYFAELAGCPVFLPGQLIDLWLATVTVAFPSEQW
jgi:hypothetical protein